MAHPNTKKNCVLIVLEFLDIKPIRISPMAEELTITFKDTALYGRQEVIEKFEVEREHTTEALLIIMSDNSRLKIID